MDKQLQNSVEAQQNEREKPQNGGRKELADDLAAELMEAEDGADAKTESNGFDFLNLNEDLEERKKKRMEMLQEWREKRKNQTETNS